MSQQRRITKAHTHTLPPCVSRQSQNPALNCAPPHLHSKCHRMAKSQLEFAGSVSFDSGEPAIRPCCIGSAFKMLNFCSNATFFRYQLTNCMIIQGGARKYHGSFKNCNSNIKTTYNLNFIFVNILKDFDTKFR